MIYRIVCVAILCLALNTPSNGQSYSVTPITGSEETSGTGLNTSAEVSGYKNIMEFAPARDPYIWSDGQFIPILNGMGQVEDINSASAVVGWTYFLDPNAPPGNYIERAFIFENGTMTWLANFTQAYAINNRGQVVGDIKASVGRHAFVYNSGTITDLGVLPNTEWSCATDINNSGQIIGWSSRHVNPGSQSIIHGFLYENGTMTDIGSLTGGRVTPIAINDLGQIVVSEWNANERPLRTRVFLYDHGVRTEISPFPGDNSISVSDINNAGQVVGTSEDSTNLVGTGRHPFIYQNGQMVDISLPNGPNGPRFATALAINNLGQILVRKLGMFILSPQPAAAPTLLTKQDGDDSIALSSILSTAGPFAVNSLANFSSDQRTRVMLFVTGLGVPVDPAIITAEAEDAQHQVQSLTVEHVGSVPNFEWITQINVILPAELDGAGDVLVSVKAGGAPSNQALLKIK